MQTLRKQLGLVSLVKIDTSDMSVDELDDACDDGLESEEQRHARLQAQLRHDKERAKRRKEFEKKKKGKKK